MISGKYVIPAGLSLTIKVSKVVGKAGRAGAKAVRERLKARAGAKGSLPMPQDHDNQGLQRTGEMIRSVDFRTRRGTDKEAGTIFPTGKRERPKKTSAKTATRNAAILSILLATNDKIADSDPMGRNDALDKVLADAAQKSISEQKAGLKAKGKRTIK
jgi:hypothetical protein